MEKADRSGGILGVPDREKDMYWLASQREEAVRCDVG